MGNPKYITSPNNSVRLVASEASWIESKAVEQLKTTAKRDNIKLAVGLPDLHPGKGLPIGAAFISQDMIHPTLIGNDIGCAMSFWQTDIKTRKVKLDRWAKKLHDLEKPWEGDSNSSRDDWCDHYKLKDGLHNTALGTIGGGNHFAELQQIDQVFDEENFTSLGLEENQCTLLVHSGSRALGQSIFIQILQNYGAQPLADNSSEARTYLAEHDEAVKWSEANRALIAYSFMQQIGGKCHLISDAPHNMIRHEKWHGKPAWFHRKGAASAREKCLMIPGSRGTRSYLVAPMGDQDETAWSLAHGAGRRWQRGLSKSRLSHKYKVKDLERNTFGGHIICENRELIYDEAPQAYKNIEQVISDLKNANLIKVIASYKPLLTYKQRRGS